MGLDIRYFKNLRPCGDPDAPLMVASNRHFPGRIEPLENGGMYECEASGHFRAGSYSGYNDWREQLAELAGYPAIQSERDGKGLRHDSGAWAATGGPFWELINFFDCEGTIGTKVCQKLAVDFQQYKGCAEKHPDERFRDLYAEWQEAFETAANNGAVHFA